MKVEIKISTGNNKFSVEVKDILQSIIDKINNGYLVEEIPCNLRDTKDRKVGIIKSTVNRYF